MARSLMTAFTNNSSRVFAVFAHNEERNIVHAIDSILTDCDATVLVLANGCTDSTLRKVEHLARSETRVRGVEIELGDKSNAWNLFIHTLAPPADRYYFLDGDCSIVRGSIAELESKFPVGAVNAVTAMPASGRSADMLSREIASSGGLLGNFYYLDSEFVQRIRALDLRIPIGTIGEDSLIGAWACWDLAPDSNWDRTRIGYSTGIRFQHRVLSLYSVDDIRLYLRRRVRYAMRRIQMNMLRASMQAGELRQLPEHIEGLYTRWSAEFDRAPPGLEWFFYRAAIRSMKRRVE